LLQEAASGGYARAAFNLGVFFRSGDYGVLRGEEASKRYMKVARELGSPNVRDEWL
jgi:TPR repeat protein